RYSVEPAVEEADRPILVVRDGDGCVRVLAALQPTVRPRASAHVHEVVVERDAVPVRYVPVQVDMDRDPARLAAMVLRDEPLNFGVMGFYARWPVWVEPGDLAPFRVEHRYVQLQLHV